MRTLRDERHHWWPICVSRHWAAEDGSVGIIAPDGSVKRVGHEKLGVIVNGHQGMNRDLLGGKGLEGGFTFERQFDRADNAFPAVLKWVEGLDRTLIRCSRLEERFVPQPASDDDLAALTECVVSLAVRSPRNREAFGRFIDAFCPPGLQRRRRERNFLIAANMSTCQRKAADSIGARAKFAIVYSQSAEFIFGDGFYHNLIGNQGFAHQIKLFAPVTPHVSVIVYRPMEWMVEPRLSTIVVEPDEVDVLNYAVKVYSRNFLFFKMEEPALDDVFARGEHGEFVEDDSLNDALMYAIPGAAQLHRPTIGNW